MTTTREQTIIDILNKTPSDTDLLPTSKTPQITEEWKLIFINKLIQIRDFHTFVNGVYNSIPLETDQKTLVLEEYYCEIEISKKHYYFYLENDLHTINTNYPIIATGRLYQILKQSLK